MFDNVKAVAIRFMPPSRRRPPSEVGWGQIVLYVVLYGVVTAAYRALALMLLVWVIHRYWWHGLPLLGYLPALAITLLIPLASPFDRPEADAVPQPAEDPQGTGH